MRPHPPKPADRPTPGPADEPASDEQLLARFVSGDEAALGELAQRYESAMVGLAAGIVGGPSRDRTAAMDAVQETWVRVIRHGHTYDGRASVKTWMYTILTNVCRDRRRRDAARRTRERTRRTVEQHAAAAIDPRVLEAVADLEEPGRETVVLCFHRGLTHAQAADVLGVPLGTVKSRLHKAMTRLRERLGEQLRVDTDARGAMT
ncbi:MAG: RNA polymerase sigma factor [Planctomycetota bacterium]